MSTSASPSPRLRAAQTFLSMFANLSTATLSSVLSDDYTHEFAPASLAKLFTAGFPSKDAFIQHIKSTAALMTGFPVTPIQMVEDERQNAVWCWTKSRAEWRADVMDGEAEEWEYEGEYVFMFWMDESGEKVRKCVEMLDSLATKEKLAALSARAKENIKKRTGEDAHWF